MKKETKKKIRKYIAWYYIISIGVFVLIVLFAFSYFKGLSDYPKFIVDNEMKEKLTEIFQHKIQLFKSKI